MNGTHVTTCGRRAGPAARTTRPDTAAEARDTAREFLSDLTPAPDPETIENVVLVVSELVTNALRHAGGITRLRLAADRSTVEITVRDPSPARPRPRHPDITGYEGGYGLTLVNFLAHFVTVSPCPDGGKQIRASLSR